MFPLGHIPDGRLNVLGNPYAPNTHGSSPLPGLGLQPPANELGCAAQGGAERAFHRLRPWLMVPGLFMIVTVLTFNFVGDGRDADDPYASH